MPAVNKKFNIINVVIPVYNEKDNIYSTIREINYNIKSDHVIFFIYDFDEDDSIPPIKDFMRKQDNIYLVKNIYGRGALNAIKTGFESANDGAVLVLMADLSDELTIVDKMFAKINEGYDIVCGSRYMPGGKQIGGPLFKKLLSRLAGLSLHHLAGIPTHDVTNSFKMYKTNVLKNIQIESSGGFELGMEIVIKAYKGGYKITEIPSTWKDRESGQSNFKLWAWLPKYIYWYIYALFK